MYSSRGSRALRPTTDRLPLHPDLVNSTSPAWTPTPEQTREVMHYIHVFHAQGSCRVRFYLRSRLRGKPRSSLSILLLRPPPWPPCLPPHLSHPSHPSHLWRLTHLLQPSPRHHPSQQAHLFKLQVWLSFSASMFSVDVSSLCTPLTYDIYYILLYITLFIYHILYFIFYAM